MDILSIGKTIEHNGLNITTISESELTSYPNIQHYDYIIISGGDGTIRRILKILHTIDSLPSFILNPTGSFNVVAKLHRVPDLKEVLDQLSDNTALPTNTQQIYGLNQEIFLFSAGNMGDLQHIFLSETLRFGLLKKGIRKYILATLFLFPVHLIMTPFMLVSKRRFFIFTPLGYIEKFGSFYGKVTKEIYIDLENQYNMIELDGDIVTIAESTLHIKHERNISIVTKKR